MDFQQIRDFVNPAVAQATGLQEVDNLQMPVPVAYVPVQIVIDGALSLTSENPVQNKVIAVAIQNLDGRITAIEGQFSEGVTEAVNNWLAAHPEATTTVQDGAITYAKLDTNLKGEVDQISELKSAFNKTSDTIGDELYTFSPVTKYGTSANYRLNESDGFCSYDENYQMDKYPVTAGKTVKIFCEDRFQFNVGYDVPLSGTSKKVGETYSRGYFIVTVPATATTVIISTPKNGTSSVYMANSTAFDNIDNAIGAVDEKEEKNKKMQSIINNMLDQIDSKADQFTPIIIPKNGGYYNTSGVWTANANINSVGPIPVLPKQVLHISTNSAGVVRTLFECDEDENLIEVIRTGTNNNITDSILNSSDKIKYYFASSGSSFDMKITISNKFILNGDRIDHANELDILSQKFNTSNQTLQTNLNYTNIFNTADYALTTPFFLKKGVKITLAADVSTSYYAIIKTDEYGVSHTGVVVGVGGEHQFYEYTATEDCYIQLQYFVNNKAKLYFPINWNDKYFLDDRRRAVVSFSFDDMHVDDDQFYNLFASHGLTCGFALIGVLSIDNSDTERYLAWQKQGFTVLSHSINSDTMQNGDCTVAEATERMKLSKERLYARGYKADGWVTPSSNLGSDFMDSLKDFYEYGYTSYYGSYPSDDNNGRPPYTTFNTSPYELYRVHLDSTLENLKSALDACIANTGWLNLYLHAFEITEDKMTKLDAFLDYIEGKIADGKLKCLAPNKAYEYYYHVRKQDLSN